ncbi:DNA ligase [Candidatus Dependentiae bacterium]|nr:MAG: DNA ligase [Candidatus Dependentiae bacterium]
MVWKKIRKQESNVKAYEGRPHGTIQVSRQYLKAGSKGPLFVVQKHDARQLHYDFRLEVDGVLKSWAIPKGPSMNPAVKRLAVPTDDHPLGYADFEGVIPEGEYGAGIVMVWDIGTYENIKRRSGQIVSMKQCYKDGRIEVFLNGKKLTGGFALIRTVRSKNETPYWLLIKMRDEYASAYRSILARQPKSALTGRTLKQIAADVKKVRTSKKVKKIKKTKSVKKTKRVKKARKG